MRKSRRTRWRLALLKWHRRIGIVVALGVVMLAATGILLNHTHRLGLDQRPLTWPWLLEWYGVGLPPVTAYAADGSWLLEAEQRLYLGGEAIADCAGLTGAVTWRGWLAVACTSELLLFDRQGQLIERIDSSYGLPVPVTGLAVDQQRLLVRHRQQWYRADAELLAFAPAERTAPDAITPRAPPAALTAQVQRQAAADSINWERVLQDLHSGRLFGAAGVVVVDLVAALMAVLAISGAWVWLSRPGRFRRRERH